jgi:hypothetical protein
MSDNFKRPCASCGNPVHRMSKVCKVCGHASPWVPSPQPELGKPPEAAPPAAPAPPRAPEAPAVQPARKAPRTVTVACKFPGGMRLQLSRPEQRFEPIMGGGTREYTVYIPTGRPWFVSGPAYPVGVVPKGFPKAPEVEGGMALTHGIPADFWEQWIEQHKRAEYVVSGIIFALPNAEDAAIKAREHEKELCGLEPLSLDEDEKGKLKDPRVPKPINLAVAKLATEQRTAAG